MKDDLIDCSGVEDLRIPTQLECWKQQAHLLACEVGDLQTDLSDARRSIQNACRHAYRGSKQRDALALEVTKLGWELGDSLRENIRTTGK
jgi:hypothetical protein